MPQAPPSLQEQEAAYRKAVEIAKAASRVSYSYFINYVFSQSFNQVTGGNTFVGGQYIEDVATHLEQNPYTMDVTGRDHYKSTRLYTDILRSIFIDEGNGFEAHYFSYRQELAAYHLKKVKRMIKDNFFFNGLIDHKPTSESIIDVSWQSDGRHMTVQPQGLLSSIRGIHAERIYVDDPLRDPENKLDPLSILKINRIMTIELLPMVKKNGICRVVGCVGLDTLVQTKEGFVTIKSLFPEGTDFTKKQLIPFKKEVFGKNGWDTTSNLFVNGPTDTNKIVLSGGYSLECSQIHPLWSAPAHAQPLLKKMAWRKSSDLKIGDFVAISLDNNIFGNRQDLSDDESYLYGLYMAEGSAELKGRANRITISNPDPVIKNFVARAFGFHNTDGMHSRKNNKLMVEKMKWFGMPLGIKAPYKFIPEALLQQTRAIQRSFLQGLYDGDGSSSWIGDANLAVVLSSSSKKMLQIVQQILLNFGVQAHLNVNCRAGEAMAPQGRIKRTIGYTLKTTGYNSARFMKEIGFRIPYKNKSFDWGDRPKPKLYDGFIWKRIKSIEKSRSLTVDFTIPQSQSFITNGIVSHNTPQTNSDFFFSKDLAKKFAVWITGAMVSRSKKLALWPEWMTFQDLLDKESIMGASQFAQEYNAVPSYTEDSFLPKEKVYDLSTLPNWEFQFWDNLDDKTVVAGFDIGKKSHPSHLAVFIRTERYGEDDETIYHYKQIYSKWMDGWDYTDQIEYLRDAIENLNIFRLKYDDTRSEFESFREQGTLPSEMEPVSFGARNKRAMATKFRTLIETAEIELVDVERDINQLLGVNADLDAIQSSEGHSDNFSSICLAIAEGENRTPRVRIL